MASSEKKRKGEDEKQVVVPKSSADVQRLKLEKLMKNPVSVFSIFFKRIFCFNYHLFGVLSCLSDNG